MGEEKHEMLWITLFTEGKEKGSTTNPQKIHKNKKVIFEVRFEGFQGHFLILDPLEIFFQSGEKHE